MKPPRMNGKCCACGLDIECKCSDRKPDPFIGNVQNLKAERDQARAEAERLWGLLDDISTLGDMLKPEINHYFNAIHRKVEKRHGIITSDGYTLKWTAPTPA